MSDPSFPSELFIARFTQSPGAYAPKLIERVLAHLILPSLSKSISPCPAGGYRLACNYSIAFLIVKHKSCRWLDCPVENWTEQRLVVNSGLSTLRFKSMAADYNLLPLAGWPRRRKVLGHFPSPQILKEPKSLYQTPSAASGT